MITASEALEKIKRQYPNILIKGIGETTTCFAIAYDDSECYKTVDKNTGVEGEMWIWEFGMFSLDGKAKILDLSELNKKRAS